MSRHRNVRSMNYSDEYDGYDDVYGHSVEDDYTISPSDASFMYDRSRQQSTQISNFLREEDDIAEEDESFDSDSLLEKRNSEHFKLPILNDIDGAKLQSCLDEIHSVVGDSVAESILIETIISCQFDLTKSLDTILKNQTYSIKEAPKPQRIRKLPAGAKDVEANEASLSSLGLEANLSPTITVATPINKTSVVKGFEIKSKTDNSSELKPETVTPRSQSPAFGRIQNENDSERKTPARLLRAEDEWKKIRGNSKEQIHMVTIGHVDAGKSTLMGHLLYKLGNVNQKIMHKYEQESKKIGKQSFMYAWILDETGEERNRGITMDVGQSQLETETKIVTLLDAPGHKDFIPNMITGAAQADVALLVVDATRGEFETGFESGGQTREHALLVRSLGVSQLCVAINKLDTVSWSETRFLEIAHKLNVFLKQAGFREKDVMFIPCSGLTGENLTTSPSVNELREWYSGPYLLQAIDKFKVPERPISKPLRISVSDIYKGTGSGFCISGKVEAGMIQAGDKVLVQPQNELGLVKALAIDECNTQSAFAGDNVSVTIANYDQQNISVGYILSDPMYPAPVALSFEARIVVFNVAVPITRGFSVIFHQQSLAEPAIIMKLNATLQKSTGEILKRRPRCLTKNSSALVTIETVKPICLELYKDMKELGRFMLRINGTTIAAGLITKIL
uniref:Tr-type G domain-containing protein n=2 Tax=Clastoptera arizonana TaxID=38151 RepID=A0A1B6DUA2_9HEMI